MINFCQLPHWHPTTLVFCLALSVLAACSTNPRLEMEPPSAQRNIRPQVQVDEGSRAASPKEYQDLLEENAPDPETHAMLDQLLSVT